MAVQHIGEVYRCNICGNVVRVVEVGGGTLVCCGQDMERIEKRDEPTSDIPGARLPDDGA